LHAFLIASMRTTCPAHPVFLHLITLTYVIFSEAYKLWSSSPCSLLHPPATSSLLSQNILLGTLFSKHPQYILPLVRQAKSHTNTKSQVKQKSFIYFNL
jgi:hypothetical protein